MGRCSFTNIVIIVCHCWEEASSVPNHDVIIIVTTLMGCAAGSRTGACRGSVPPATLAGGKERLMASVEAASPGNSYRRGGETVLAPVGGNVPGSPSRREGETNGVCRGNVLPATLARGEERLMAFVGATSPRQP